MAEKLPVFATLKGGFVEIARHWRRMWAYALSLAVIAVTIVVVAAILGLTLTVMAGKPGQGSVGFLVLAVEFAFMAAMLPVCTSFQRLILLGPASRVGFAYGREEWRALWNTVKLSLVMVALLFPCALLMGVGAGTIMKKASQVEIVGIFAIVTLAIGLFVVMPVMARLAMILPSAAIGERLSLRESWRTTRGNVWRLIAIMILGYLVIGVPQMIVQQAFPRSGLGVALIVLLSMFNLFYQTAVWALVYGRLRPVAAVVPDDFAPPI